MINPPNLTFDAETHTYRYDGKVVPSVTQVLRPLVNYGRVDPRVLAAKADLGTRVHFACELDDEDDLDEDSVEDDVAGYLQGYRAFKRDSGAEILHNEVRVFHAQLLYAGTIDLIANIKQQRWVIDIKTALATPVSVGPQTAAYRETYLVPDVKRGALRLRPDGTYRLDELNDQRDMAVFVSCLTIHRYLESVK